MMGQQEVISLLEKSKEWNTAEEIADKLNVDGRVVRRALMVLYKFNEVLREKCKNSIHFKYVYKAVGEEQKNKKILEDFQEVGEENFGSKGLEK